MADLATTSDVEASLGRSLTADETPRAATLLVLASAAVCAEANYMFAPGTYTIGGKVHAGKVRLAAKVASIEAVRAVDQCDGTVTELDGYTTYRGTIYGLTADFIEVDFTVDAPVPDEVVSLVAGIVASTLSGPPIGASAEAVGAVSISYVNATGRVWLAASDKAILRRYKRPRAALNVG